jgi:hypothetical protein
MAITIDGTAGTIAGLVAGGLPSGSVTSATIADATIASGDIASGVVPAGGKILQVVYAETTNTGGYALETTSSTFQDIPGMTVDITPASTSNYLLIMANAWFDTGAGGADVGMSMELYRVSTAIGSTVEYITENQKLGSATIIIRDQVVSTSSQTFFGAAKTFGGGSLRVGSANEKATITIMEIAG